MTAPAATISALLAAFPADPVADVLATVAERCGKVGRGWAPWAVNVAMTKWRREAARMLGRPLTADEATALEACIRAHLSAGPCGARGHVAGERCDRVGCDGNHEATVGGVRVRWI